MGDTLSTVRLNPTMYHNVPQCTTMYPQCTTMYHNVPTMYHNVPQCSHNVPTMDTQWTHKGHNVEVNDITDSTNYFNPTAGGVGCVMVGGGNDSRSQTFFAIQKPLKTIAYARANFPKICSHTFEKKGISQILVT